MELTILMPCLNEAETIEICVRKARSYLESRGIAGEVLVADNGSTDGSQRLAERCGARVVPIPMRGYGAALQGGIHAAQGTFIVVGDGDDSYDFTALDPFVEKLRGGAELVMGNRFLGGIQPNAMPPLHRYLGNPVLTGIGRLFFKSPCGDFHCGLRGFRRDSILSLGLTSPGMEFASEMVVKATLRKLRITEVPTTLSPDGRSRAPHLRSWRDGWRHLRFLLLFSPVWLFFYPGLALLLLGTISMAWLLPTTRYAFGVTFDIHTLFYAALGVVVGFQLIAFATFTKVFAIPEGLLPEDPRLTRAFRWVTLETGLIVGGVLILLGIGGSIFAVSGWARESFGALNTERTLRIVMPSVFSLTMGVQIVFSSFFLSILGLSRR